MTKDEQWLLNEKYNGEKTAGFFTDCERLTAGEPLGYVIGFTPFLDTKIHLDSSPLIPRPETEFWVEQAVAEIKKINQPRVLDLCAGSGAIGVAVAKEVPGARVDFGEIDACHLSTIAKNLGENNIDCTRYHIWQSDLYENIAGTFDHILTNPPYIDPALDRTETSVKDFEPHLALYGGKDGLEIIEKIISGAPKHLSNNGQLWLEHEPEQSRAIQALGAQHGFTVTTHTDQYNTERYSVLKKV